MIPISKFNQRMTPTASARSPLSDRSATADATTYEGAPAYTRSPEAELFLLGVSNFVGEDTFYEKAEDRDNRYAALARGVAVSNGPWFASYVRWLRSEGNMRSAALVAAAEGVKARIEAKVEGDGVTNRSIVASVLQRADEPGEFVAYWQSRFGENQVGGKAKLAMSVKRGIGERVEHLYNEYSAFKYDTSSKGKRFGDVVELVHPMASTAERDTLYTWLVDRRHDRDDGEYPGLAMLHARRALEQIPAEARAEVLTGFSRAQNTDAFRNAGVTWEWLASWYGRELDAAFWESMIPTMGYMALLRNLRNFDQTGVHDDVANSVAMKLRSEEEVRKSRQLPFRFYSAYEAAKSSLRWGPALSGAVQHSLANIPSFPGRTLVLSDSSGSMHCGLSGKSKMTPAEAAALFAGALSCASHRDDAAQVDFYAYANSPVHIPHGRGDALFVVMDRFKQMGINGGTETAKCLKQTYQGHDRVVILTDEQTFGPGRSGWGYVGDVSSQVPANVPIYSFNLEGYRGAMLPDAPRRYQLGGLTDHTFAMIPLLEAGERAVWPWEK